MTLRDALNKIRTNLPFVALGLSIFSTNMVINNHYRNKKLVETALETNRLITEVNNKQDILINKNEITEKIRNYTIEATKNVNSVNEKGTTIDELIKKLDDPNISTEDREFITNVLIKHNNQSIEYLNKSNELLQKIIDEINKSGDKFINEIYDWIQKYLDYFSTLSLEQMAMITNFWGFVIILNSIINITIIFYGDYLIKYFRLEQKFPKLTKFIQIRRKFQFFYLNINILIIFSLSVYFLWFNIKIYYIDIIGLYF